MCLYNFEEQIRFLFMCPKLAYGSVCFDRKRKFPLFTEEKKILRIKGFKTGEINLCLEKVFQNGVKL